MFSKISSFAIQGMEGVLVEVEVDLSPKSPKFLLVGLPDTAVKESQYRVRTAVKNAGYVFPYKRILINLAPADIKKQGPMYDLPIALAVLAAGGQIATEKLADVGAVGELALDGSIRRVSGVIAMVEAAYQKGIGKIIVPYGNRREAAVLEQVRVYPVRTLAEAIAFFAGPETAPFRNEDCAGGSEENSDYSEVCGQECGKRAMMIAVAGGHHCLMVGPPGSGKTMLARRLTTLLPRLGTDDALETTRIYSVAGLLPENCGLMHIPPFRAPHHTISCAGLAGGGSQPRPGELSLAHNGVLFLDELPEFPRATLEVLRQPLESEHVVIARARESVRYPARFLLVAAMNPCPCGYLGDSLRQCECFGSEIGRYRRRISGPLMDRFDIHLQIPRLQYRYLVDDSPQTSSADMRREVLRVREIQEKRLEGTGSATNSRMSPRLVKKHCALDREGERLLQRALTELGLSARAYQKILKIARTIADLAGSENPRAEHVAEAIQYRSLDRAVACR